MENFETNGGLNSPTEKFTTEEKLTLEIEKLKEEIKNFRKPFYFNPIAIVAIITSLLSIASFFYNLKISELDDKISENKRIENVIDNKNVKLEYFQNKNKNDSLKRENSNLSQSIIEKNNTINNLSKSVNTFAVNVTGLKQAKTIEQQHQIINNLDQEVAKTQHIFKQNQSKNLEVAKNEERKGFLYLAKKDYDNALKAFVLSENAYNRYHVSYDIAKILLDNKATMSSDVARSDEILKEIINKFGNFAPKSVRDQILAEIN